ncbi:MAG: NAD-dependent epimerase/dehydratase family protein [Armatimonadota bacterium]|nr:MAG: NAD-dependent epimerase/dehydratase family protein [Armatimonadota bacterium]
MRVLVTGAAGFMGSHVAEGMVAAGHEVTGIDDLSGGFRRNLLPEVKFHRLDLRDAEETDRAVRDNPPEILCHLAANAREGASQFQPRDVCGRNLMAYVNVLVPAIRCGVKKVVLYSSMAVYGDQEAPFDEGMARRPADVYGVNKTAMEETTEILADVHEFSYTIIRPHNVFGERQSLQDKFRNVVGIFMNRIMRGEPLYVYGDGEQRRAFSYIGDSLPAFLKAAELKPELDRQRINVGGKRPITVNELAKLVSAEFGAEPEVVHLPARPREVKDAYCTWQKSEQMLAYKEQFGLEEGIRRMGEWARALGPQPWTDERLELPSEKAPRIWLPGRPGETDSKGEANEP